MKMRPLQYYVKIRTQKLLHICDDPLHLLERYSHSIPVPSPEIHGAISVVLACGAVPSVPARRDHEFVLGLVELEDPLDIKKF